MKVIIAISGGIDSMYMANRASELFPEATFAIAHCNFGLRGEDSDGDEEFVRSWAAEKGIKFYSKRFDTLNYASSNGISTEMAARELRYNWFYKLAAEIGAEAIAVAHNANDNAETLILNLLRGTGSKGLRGMRTEVTRNDKEYSKDLPKLLRPLLKTSREEIYNYMVSNNLPWREDRTNNENIYQRNIIRNEIFPLFEKINPSFVKTLNSDIAHFTQVDDVANSYYENLKTQFIDNKTIIVSKLLSLDHWEYLLWKSLEGSGILSDQYTSLVSCLKSGRHYAGKHFGPILGASGRLEILTEDVFCHHEQQKCHCEGVYDRGNPTKKDNLPPKNNQPKIELIPREEILKLKQPQGILLLDADLIKLPLKIRKFQNGDWFIPFGMKGKKKVSDYLTDLHYSVAQKADTLIIEHPSEPTRVAAVLYSRIDDSLKISPKTKNVLRIWE